MDDRALDHALEAGRRLGVFRAVGDQVFEFGFEIGKPGCALIYRGSTLQARMTAEASWSSIRRQQQMLKRRVFVVPLIGEGKRPVKRLL